MADSDGKVVIKIEDNIQQASKRMNNYEKQVNNFDVSGLEGGINDLNKTISELSAKFADFNKPVQDDSKALKELENTVKSQNDTIEQLKNSYNNLKTELDNLKKPVEDNAKRFNDLGKSYNTALVAQEKLFYALNVDKSFHNTSNAVGEAVQRMKELAFQGDTTSKEFQNLKLYVNEANTKLQETNKIVDKATGGFSKQNSGMSSLMNAAKGLVAGYVGIQGAIKAFNFSMESVNAYRVQERAIASLDTTLKNAGVYTAEYSQHIQSLASDIQSYSNYGDEAIIKAQALGQSFAGQVPFTDAATKAVIDFAAATGMDLDQAFTLVGKSVGSSTNALSRYGVELEKGMTDSQKMEAITKQLGERYSGQAQQMADANVQLQNSIGDMKEAFGSVLNGYVTNWQSGMNKIVQATTRAINSVRIMHAEVSSLNTNELTMRMDKNNKQIKYLEAELPRLTTYSAGYKNAQKKRAELIAENNLIQEQIKYIKQREKVQSNVKPIKFSDEDFTSPNVSTKTSRSGSRNAKKSSNVKQVKDDYEKLQAAVQSARREVELAAIKYGTSSDEVRQKFAIFKAETEKLQAIDKIFDVQKIEEPKTKFQELNDKIAETKQRLQELYLSEGQSENFLSAKNELSQLETTVQDMNTAISSRVGLDWENVTNSIKSNLTSALLTPLQEGESAFNRLATIGLNAVQLVGQEIIKNLLQQITLEKTILAIKTAGRAVKALFSYGTSELVSGGFEAAGMVAAAKGAVFNGGNVIPFAKGGVVSKPTVFPMANGGTGLMGEAGAEAVMPLRRMSNGRLGVEASGNGKSGNAVQVNIYNQSNSQVETRKRDDGSMDIIIKRVNEALMNERTSSGFRAAYQREDRKGLQAV